MYISGAWVHTGLFSNQTISRYVMTDELSVAPRHKNTYGRQNIGKSHSTSRHCKSQVNPYKRNRPRVSVLREYRLVFVPNLRFPTSHSREKGKQWRLRNQRDDMWAQWNNRTRDSLLHEVWVRSSTGCGQKGHAWNIRCFGRKNEEVRRIKQVRKYQLTRDCQTTI